MPFNRIRSDRPEESGPLGDGREDSIDVADGVVVDDPAPVVCRFCGRRLSPESGRELRPTCDECRDDLN